ncbi:MAG TPA: four helix bundle protein [Saprospiraceae bacterium]|nr:four helix bundle protein [Saprospiraceae bacterium]HMP24130.1 four helix bundle protein [Saprospiraceae bacterium]
MKRHNFKELKIWQASMELVKDTYSATNDFPKSELYGLTQQIRKAAVSVPSNIAEGCGRGSDAQLAHFLDIAQGSAFELETQLYLANALNFLNTAEMNILVTKLTAVQKMIDGFKNKIS